MRYLRSLFSWRNGVTRIRARSRAFASGRPRRERGRTAADRLWELLRTRGLRALDFKRQHPLGPFVVEFICLEQALVIEIERSRSAAHAATRRVLLERLGYRVLRVTENEVFDDLKDVRRAITRKLRLPGRS